MDLSKYLVEDDYSIDVEIHWELETRLYQVDGKIVSLNPTYLPVASLIEVAKNWYKYLERTIEVYEAQDNMECADRSHCESLIKEVAQLISMWTEMDEMERLDINPLYLAMLEDGIVTPRFFASLINLFDI